MRELYEIAIGSFCDKEFLGELMSGITTLIN